MELLYREKIEGLREPVKAWIREEIKAQVGELRKNPLELARLTKPSIAWLSNSEQYKDASPEQLKAALFQERIFTAKELISYIDAYIEACDEGDMEHAQAYLFQVGRFLERVCILFFEKHREDISFKVIQSEHTKKQKRWKERNYPIELALQVADALYKDGDDRPHHKMVEYLLDIIPAFKEMQSGDDYMSCKRRLLREVGELVKLKYPERFYAPGKRGV